MRIDLPFQIAKGGAVAARNAALQSRRLCPCKTHAKNASLPHIVANCFADCQRNSFADGVVADVDVVAAVLSRPPKIRDQNGW
jgi:hypothetical protein